MEDKYYTPSIEEFHVGFEFEANQLDTNNWNTIVTEDIELENIKGLKRTVINKQVRVKYLDKDDIESLGFTNIIGTDTFSKRIYADDASIAFQDKDFIQIYNFDGNKVFEGSVKNKSELKKLLKQLNIK